LTRQQHPRCNSIEERVEVDGSCSAGCARQIRLAAGDAIARTSVGAGEQAWRRSRSGDLLQGRLTGLTEAAFTESPL
jgi:hypothetical protein